MTPLSSNGKNSSPPWTQPGSVGLVQTQYFTFAQPPHELALESGATLGPVTLAYETYGALNAGRSNAILIVHALTGDAHIAGYHTPEDAKPGWWDEAVGPGKMYDTDRYFVICSNIIGGCQGSTGPRSINPATGRPYGLSFPVITIRDIVEAQRHLIDHLGIERLLAVVGGSMGGMQALDWAARYPDRVAACLPIATCARSSAQTIALNEVGRQAIYADPRWRRGDYYGSEPPNDGLALARMIGHITYMSDTSMREKFGRRLQTRERLGFDFETDFAVESYLRYRGGSFPNRFDANSYLYVTKAIDYFDMAADYGGDLAESFKRIKARFLVLSFTSDWLYPSYQSQEIVRALLKNGLDVTYFDIESDYGHDSFLVEVELLTEMIGSFLARVYREETRRRTRRETLARP
ncbi:MAG: homoserine O-acetyltransferase [Anaerolineae bacterium]|nr:homoserine O-acetyltransferase [Anaerolineae bacterium]